MYTCLPPMIAASNVITVAPGILMPTDVLFDRVTFLNQNSLVDSSKFPNVMTLNGDVHLSTDVLLFGGKLLDFNGVNTSITVLSSSAVQPDYDFEIEGFIYPRDLSGVRTILMKADGGTKEYQIVLYQNKLQLDVWHLDGSVSTLKSTTDVVLNTMQHICLSYKDRLWKLFLHGTHEATSNFSNVIKLGDGPLSMGAANSGEGWYFDGLIGNFRITKEVRRTENFTPPEASFATIDATPSVDKYWAQRVFGLRADWEGDAATFRDETDIHPLTRVGGNTSVDRKRFFSRNASLKSLGQAGSGLRAPITSADSVLNLDAVDFTIRFKMFVPAAPAFGYLLCFGGGLNYSWGDLTIDVDSFNIRVAIRSQGNESAPDILYYAAVGSVPANRWSEVQLHRQSGTFVMTINKTISWTLNDPRAIRATNNAAGLGIGCSGYGSSGLPEEAFTGNLDDIHVIRDVVVPVDEPLYFDNLRDFVTVKINFNGPNGSMSGVNEVPERPTYSFGGNAMIGVTNKLHGRSSAVFYPPAWIYESFDISRTEFRTGNFCIELSIRSNDSVHRIIAANRRADVYGWRIYKNDTNEIVYENYTVAGTIVLKSLPIFNSAWYHIKIDRQDGTVYLYVNDEVVDFKPDASDMVATYGWILGWEHTGNGGVSWAGEMDAFRVTKKSRRTPNPEVYVPPTPDPEVIPPTVITNDFNLTAMNSTSNDFDLAVYPS